MVILDENNLKRDVAPNPNGNVAARTAYYFSEIGRYKGAEPQYLLKQCAKDAEFFNALKHLTPNIEKAIRTSQANKGKLKIQDVLVSLCRLPTSCFADIGPAESKEEKKVIRPTPTVVNKETIKAGGALKRKRKEEIEIEEKSEKRAKVQGKLFKFKRHINNMRIEGYGTTKSKSKTEQGFAELRTKYNYISDEIFNNHLRAMLGGTTKLMLAVSWASHLDSKAKYEYAKKHGSEAVFEPKPRVNNLTNYTEEEQSFIIEYREHCQSTKFGLGTICPIPAKFAEMVKTDLASQPAYYTSILGDMPPIPCSKWFDIKLTPTGDLSLTYKSPVVLAEMLSDIEKKAARRALAQSPDAVSARALPHLGLHAAPSSSSSSSSRGALSSLLLARPT